MNSKTDAPQEQEDLSGPRQDWSRYCYGLAKELKETLECVPSETGQNNAEGAGPRGITPSGAANPAEQPRYPSAPATPCVVDAIEKWRDEWCESLPERAIAALDNLLAAAPVAAAPNGNDTKDAARWRQAIHDKEFPKMDRNGGTWMHVDRVTGDIIERDTPEEVMDVAIANRLHGERSEG